MNNILYKPYALAIVFTIAGIALTSCSEDDEAKTPLDKVSVTTGVRTVSSIVFTWPPVSGAVQYGYELNDMEGTQQAGGVTNGTSVTVTGLKPNTTYEFRAWAYAPVSGDRLTSPVTSLTASTNEVRQLQSPDVSWEQTSAGIELSWDEVEHADYYIVTYDTSNGKEVADTTFTNRYTIVGLSIGEYLVRVASGTDDENYSTSPGSELTVKRTKRQVWSTSCTYESEVAEQTYACTLALFEDGSYEIQGVYGSSDCLEFTIDREHVNEDGNPEIVLTNYYLGTPPYYYFIAGDYKVCTYYVAGSGYTAWEGDTDEPGLWFYVYLYDAQDHYLGGGYDYVTWEKGE